MIYLQPEYKTAAGEILNVIDGQGKSLGYLFYLYKEGHDLYVLGQLDDIGEQQNFKDVIKHYIAGLKDACGVEEDPYVYINCGGIILELDKEEDE